MEGGQGIVWIVWIVYRSVGYISNYLPCFGFYPFPPCSYFYCPSDNCVVSVTCPVLVVYIYTYEYCTFFFCQQQNERLSRCHPSGRGWCLSFILLPSLETLLQGHCQRMWPLAGSLVRLWSRGRNGLLHSSFDLFHILRYNGWDRRTLSKGQKKSYIEAVKCLQAKPAICKSTIPNSVSRFDDFQGVHIQQTFSIHFVVSIYLPSRTSFREGVSVLSYYNYCYNLP